MARIRVEVVRAGPRGAQVVSVALPAGSTVDEAVRAAGLGPAGPVGIFGKQVKPDRVLQDGDRVELYRPLVLEPMEARRRRARRR